MKPKNNSLISDQPHQALDNIVNILELLQFLDFSVGINKQAEFGLFLVHQLLLDAVKDVDKQLLEQELLDDK